MSCTTLERLPRQESRLPKTIGTALIGWRKELRKSEGTTSNPGIPRPQFKNFLHHRHSHPHGVPAVSSQPHPGTAQPRGPQCCGPIEERLCDACCEKWREDGINNSVQRTHGKDGNPRRWKLLTLSDCYGALSMGTDVNCWGVD
jgi:hypothetical protein